VLRTVHKRARYTDVGASHDQRAHASELSSRGKPLSGLIGTGLSDVPRPTGLIGQPGRKRLKLLSAWVSSGEVAATGKGGEVGDRHTVQGVLPRLVLLVLLALGVGAMHTLGHPAEEQGHASAAAMHVMSESGSHDATTAIMGPHAAPASTPDGPTGPAGHLDPLTMCIAVLLAVTVLVSSIAWKWARWIVGDEPTGAAPGHPLPSHDPPRYSLTLSRLAVMRI
jgi:hypothetical protein